MSGSRFLIACVLTGLMTTHASAGGFDRAGLGVGLIFEKGNMVEFSYARAMPTIRANPDLFGDIANDYNMLSYSLKMDLGEKFALGLQVGQPYGLDVGFNLAAVTSGDFYVGGSLNSAATSAILRYRFNDNFGIHAGAYEATIGGTLTISDPVSLGRSSGFGAIVGLSAEVPKIAARVALTWFSGTKHSFGDGLGEFNAPPTVNLDFQTGVAPDTLLFGQVRWGGWSQSRLAVADIPIIKWNNNSLDYSLGLGRRFNDHWSGALLWNYTPKNPDDRGFSLSPTNGSVSFGMAVVYTEDKWKLSLGVQKITLGDNSTLAPLIDWAGNGAIGAGFKIAHTF